MKFDKGATVVPHRVSDLFGAEPGRACCVLRWAWRNGEGWLRLADLSTGDVFESPDCFWRERTRVAAAA